MNPFRQNRIFEDVPHITTAMPRISLYIDLCRLAHFLSEKLLMVLAIRHRQPHIATCPPKKNTVKPASQSASSLFIEQSSLTKSQGLCADKELRRDFVPGHPQGLIPETRAMPRAVSTPRIFLYIDLRRLARFLSEKCPQPYVAVNRQSRIPHRNRKITKSTRETVVASIITRPVHVVHRITSSHISYLLLFDLRRFVRFLSEKFRWSHSRPIASPISLHLQNHCILFGHSEIFSRNATFSDYSTFAASVVPLSVE